VGDLRTMLDIDRPLIYSPTPSHPQNPLPTPKTPASLRGFGFSRMLGGQVCGGFSRMLGGQGCGGGEGDYKLVKFL